MNFTRLNISIRWKILAGYFASALLPCLLLYNEVSLFWTCIISISVSLSFALMAIFRIMNILGRVQQALTDREELSALKPAKDELRLIEESLDHFSEYVNKSQAASFDLDLMAQTRDFSQRTVEKSYEARLVTGEPVAGEVYVLPARDSMELVTSARLIGDRAREVFVQAVGVVIEGLNRLKGLDGLSEGDRGIIEFQVMILHDPSLELEVERALSSGENLLATVSRTFDSFIDKLKHSENYYMRERIHDFDDLRERLFGAIHKASGQEASDRFAECRGKIVACEHVLPSDVFSLHDAGAKGLISKENTSSSHAQILLSSLNMPSATSIEDLAVSLLNGHHVLLDVLKGKIFIDPKEEVVAGVIENFNNRKDDVIQGPVALKSGEGVNIGVTVNNPRIDAVHAKEMSPDFVGLFRTEMHFIGQKTLPSEQELFEEYSIMTNSFDGQLVVIRMLDLGGDKICGFDSKAAIEENPSMGQRSMRFLLDNPQLFRLQLRAILKLTHGELCLLYPMISGWSELHEINQFVERVVEELKFEGHKVKVPRKGIMVEIPSIVTRFEDYVDHFDVFNIGTNDLTQYALAADRNNAAVSQYFKAHHPSVLSMISKVARLCKEKGKRAIICGQMGADLRLLPLLIGLGIDNISVNWPYVSRLKKEVTLLDKQECNRIAEEALACSSVTEVERILDFK